ncbi:MAG TPA: hydrogenase maturation nickel metallochaperone HypA [Bryobacteraceae bacterium]|nr:hydrogenase maturation nickel metallochaperone HypA [Bryobacteraceae bacterium]
MHELSIVQSIVETAVDAATQASASRVSKVYLRLGVLSGAVKESLQFCYSIGTLDTILEGSSLEIEELPVKIYCAKCREVRELPDIQRFRCPVCNTPSGDVRQGKELEIGSLEVDLP